MRELRDGWEGAPLDPTNWPVALFGDAAGIARAADWCDAAGFRARACGWDAAGQPLDPAVRLVALGSGEEASLAPLLAALGASGDEVPLVAAVPLEQVDLVSAVAPAAHILVDPPAAEAIGTLLLVARRTPAAVHDARPERDAAQLRRLTEDVERIARVLASLSSEEEGAGLEPGALPEEDDAPPIEPAAAVALIRRMVRARRMRDRYFSAELFSDPAWDMLLDLTAARVERKRVAVSSLCIAAAVPATTALRHIRSLTEAGIFVRRPDLLDGRRVFIELADRAATAMMRYLGRVARDFAAAG